MKEKLLLILGFFSIAPIFSVIIRTPQGLLDGKMELVDGYGHVTKFLGIPYAEPPVKQRRFRPPEKARNFNTIYDATYGRALCPQPESYLTMLNLTKDPDARFTMDEDCLYLNVYIPGTVARGNTIPVMVWIHGGSWIFGSGIHYDGRKLATMGEVIVVTLNYRLGILGFLPSGVTATLGLQDQIQALKWVQENIWAFGGDRNSVTIFGESAGGASVSFLCSSPAAKGLFHRAISQSGLTRSPWAFDEDRKKEKLETIRLKLKRSECYSSYDACLQQAPVSKLVELTQFVVSSLALSAWTPHVDDYVVMSDVLDNDTLIHDNIEHMIGFNTDEGGSEVEFVCIFSSGESCQYYEGISFQRVRMWVAPDMNLPTFERIGKQYINWYPGPRQRDKLSLRAAADFTTDWFYRFPVNTTATMWRNSGHNVRVYEFNVKPKDVFQLYMDVGWSDDAQHCEELPFVFAAVENQDDRLISEEMIKYWSNFAKGEPLPSWPEFGEENNYLYIGRGDDRFQLKKPLISSRKEDFWRHYFYKGEFTDQQASKQASMAQTIRFSIITFMVILITHWVQD